MPPKRAVGEVHPLSPTPDRLVADGLAGRLRPGTDEFELFVDMTARRPAGAAAAAHYRDAREHQASFQRALAALRLAPDDCYLELCFGGGQLLELALKTAGAAAGIDHSPDMLALASERNVGAIVAGRLQLVCGDVHRLPWPDAGFSRAACVNAFFFLDRPEAVLREVRRVLRPGGRWVVVTVAQGEQATTGPWRAAMRTYSTGEMSEMLRQAGFVDVTVREEGAEQLACAAAPL